MAINSRLSVDAMCSYNWSFDQDLALWTDLGVKHAGGKLGGLEDAVRIAGTRGGISGKPEIERVSPRRGPCGPTTPARGSTRARTGRG